jgi:hypothetical protein
MLSVIKRSLTTALFLTLPISAVSLGIDSKPVWAGGCNVFGCSQSSVAECNPFGCPNAPMGAECTPFGCPSSQQPAPAPVSKQPTVVLVPVEREQNPNPGGSGKAIAECMQSLLYRETSTGRYRTEISEGTAVQACQNAR